MSGGGADDAAAAPPRALEPDPRRRGVGAKEDSSAFTSLAALRKSFGAGSPAEATAALAEGPVAAWSKRSATRKQRHALRARTASAASAKHSSPTLGTGALASSRSPAASCGSANAGQAAALAKVLATGSILWSNAQQCAQATARSTGTA